MSTKAIATKLVAVASELGWVEKRGQNERQNYAYVQAVDIFADVRAALIKHKVAFTFSQEKMEVFYPDKGGRDVQITGTYAFIDSDTDEVITGNWTGFSADAGDKAGWKCLTGALKYVLLTNLLLPTGDDPENDSGEKAEKPKSEPKPVTTGPTPPKAEQVKTERVGLTNPQKTKLAVVLKEKGIKSNDQRHMFLMTAVGKHSTSQMTSADLDKALAEAEKADSEAVSNALAVV